MRWLVVLGLMLISVPAWADGDWYRENNNTGNTTTSVAPKPGQQTAFYSIAAGSTTDSKPIATAACASLTAEMVLGSGASAASVDLRVVNTLTGTCSSGRLILADIDGGGVDYYGPGSGLLNGDHGADEDGDLTAKQRGILYGFGPLPYLCVDTVTAPVGGDAYVVLTCGG